MGEQRGVFEEIVRWCIDLPLKLSWPSVRSGTEMESDSHAAHFRSSKHLYRPSSGHCRLCLRSLDVTPFCSRPPVMLALSVNVAKPPGFGYRAKYIVDSAKLMHANGGADWALDLRSKDREEVRAQLISLCGVGPKVGILQYIQRERGREILSIIGQTSFGNCSLAFAFSHVAKAKNIARVTCMTRRLVPVSSPGNAVGHSGFAPNERAAYGACFIHAQSYVFSVGHSCPSCRSQIVLPCSAWTRRRPSRSMYTSTGTTAVLPEREGERN